MRARPAKITHTFIIALVLVVVVVFAGCSRCPTVGDSSRLDISVLGAKSPFEIEQMIIASLREKYSETNISEGYTISQITNGPIHWVFVLAANAPRGLGISNLYCYERQKPDLWLLRGYVPIFESDHTKSDDRELHFQTNDNRINVQFRGVIVFTTASEVNQ